MAIRHKNGDSLQEKTKQLAINKLANIARSTRYESVQNNVVDKIYKLAENSEKGYSSRFIEPVVLSLFANFLWEKGIKKVAAWFAATFLANMVLVIATTHVALNTLLS